MPRTRGSSRQKRRRQRRRLRRFFATPRWSPRTSSSSASAGDLVHDRYPLSVQRLDQASGCSAGRIGWRVLGVHTRHGRHQLALDGDLRRRGAALLVPRGHQRVLDSPFLQEPPGALLSRRLTHRESEAGPVHWIRRGRRPAARAVRSRAAAQESRVRLRQPPRCHAGAVRAVSHRELRVEPRRRTRSGLARTQGDVVHLHAKILRLRYRSRRAAKAPRSRRQRSLRPDDVVLSQELGAAPRHGHGDLGRGREPEHGTREKSGARLSDDRVQRASRLVDRQSTAAR